MYLLRINVNNVFGIKGNAPLLGFPVCVIGENRAGKSLLLDSIKVAINGIKASDVVRESVLPEKLTTGSVTIWFYSSKYVYLLERKYERNQKTKKISAIEVTLNRSKNTYEKEKIISLKPKEIPLFLGGMEYSDDERVKGIKNVGDKLKELRIYPKVCDYLFVDRNMKAFERSVKDGLYDIGNLIVEEIKQLKENSIDRKKQLRKSRAPIKSKIDLMNKNLKSIESKLKNGINESFWIGEKIIDHFEINDLIFCVEEANFKVFFKEIDELRESYEDKKKQIKDFSSNITNIVNQYSQIIKIQEILDQKSKLILLESSLQTLTELIQFIYDLKDDHQRIELENAPSEIPKIKPLPNFPKLKEITNLIGSNNIKIQDKDFEEFRKIYSDIKDYIKVIEKISSITEEFKEKIDFNYLSDMIKDYEKYLENIKNPRILPESIKFIPARIIYSEKTGYDLFVDIIDLTEDISKINKFIQIYSTKETKDFEKTEIQAKIIQRIENKIELLKECNEKYEIYQGLTEKYDEKWEKIEILLRSLITIKNKLDEKITIKIRDIQRDLQDLKIIEDDLINLFKERQNLVDKFNTLYNFLTGFGQKFQNDVNKIKKNLKKFKNNNKDWFNFTSDIKGASLEILDEIKETFPEVGEFKTNNADFKNLIRDLNDIKELLIDIMFFSSVFWDFIKKIVDLIKDNQSEILENNENLRILFELNNKILPFTEGILLQSIIDSIHTEHILKDILETIKDQTEKMYLAVFGDQRLTINIDSGKGQFSVFEHHRKGGWIPHPSGSESPTLSFGIMYALAKKFDLPMLLDETIDGFDTTRTNIIIDEILKLCQKFKLQCVMVIKKNQEIKKEHRIYKESLIIEMKDSKINWN